MQVSTTACTMQPSHPEVSFALLRRLILVVTGVHQMNGSGPLDIDSFLHLGEAVPNILLCDLICLFGIICWAVLQQPLLALARIVLKGCCVIITSRILGHVIFEPALLHAAN